MWRVGHVYKRNGSLYIFSQRSVFRGIAQSSRCRCRCRCRCRSGGHAGMHAEDRTWPRTEPVQRVERLARTSKVRAVLVATTAFNRCKLVSCCSCGACCAATVAAMAAGVPPNEGYGDRRIDLPWPVASLGKPPLPPWQDAIPWTAGRSCCGCCGCWYACAQGRLRRVT